jgi:hypothetical protein
MGCRDSGVRTVVEKGLLNGTGMVVLVPHHVDNFFEVGVDEPIFRRGSVKTHLTP